MDGTTPTCTTAALTCIDFRFTERARDVIADVGVTGDVDLIAWPGGAFALATADRARVLEVLEFAVERHAVEQVLLMAHVDCLAAGGSGRFGSRDEEHAWLNGVLADAEGAVVEHLPGVTCRRIRLEPDGWSVTENSAGA